MSRAQPRLYPADGLGDGGFRKLELRRRPREGADLDDLREDRHAFEIGQLGHDAKFGNDVVRRFLFLIRGAVHSVVERNSIVDQTVVRSPRLWACATACARLSAPSFVKIRLT